MLKYTTTTHSSLCGLTENTRANIVYNHLINFLPKLKNGGVIAGDDIHYKEVLDDVEKFSKEYNVKVKYDYNSFLITKD